MVVEEPFISGPELDAEIAARIGDVDRTLLRENLKLTPNERFRKHRSISRFIEKLRNAGNQSRGRR